MKKATSGFTIIELIVVMSVIGILGTIAFMGFGRYQADSRDSQRSSKTIILAEALERYYDDHGEYPSCDAMKAASATVVSSTLIGIDPAALAVPNAASGTNSVDCADISSGVGADVYAYVGDGLGTCSTSGACTSYTLKYREEVTTDVIERASRR